MNQLIKIFCQNTKEVCHVPMGSTLEDIYNSCDVTLPYTLTSAKVNNKVEGLHYVAYNDKDVEFLDISSSSGLRTYVRSLTFILHHAVAQCFPGTKLRVQAPVSNGYFFLLDLGRPLTSADVGLLREEMRNIVKANLPFHRVTAYTKDAIQKFRAQGMEDKAKLLTGYKRLYTQYYTLGDTIDYYYGSLLVRTGQITLFDIVPYYDGLLLRVPDAEDPTQLKPLLKQEKMFEVFHDQHQWQSIVGVSTIGELNAAITAGRTVEMINVSEALQEKKISGMADAIKARTHVRIVLIAGPSSSGKTTFSKRLSVQLMACGLRPFAISLDNYFVNRKDTPLDANGEYDFEHFDAINLPLLTRDLQRLIAGEGVQLPVYNFQTGCSEMSDEYLQLPADGILILEGIHALNPALTAEISELVKYKIYASALTTVLLDYHNYIPTSDNRLLRRIVRDYKYRGYSAAETISRWPSVQAGERKWIFPYQENADIMFNTALMFEFAALRDQAMPLLEQVGECQPEYSEARRLHKFLSYLNPISIHGLPPTSLLREFLGGSTFKY